MAGTQKIPTRITEITLALTKPSVFQAAWTSVINALQGQHGQGSFDGGCSGDGYWFKYGYFFDFRIQVTAGSKTVAFPFACDGAILHISDIVANTTRVQYVQGSSVTLALSNASIVESFFNRVGK